MARILHIADVHLGAPLRFLGAQGRPMRRQLQATFARCIDLAIERRVDLLVVAGDLFDRNDPEPALIAFVREQLQRLGEHGIKARLLPGTHDALRDDGVLADPAWDELPGVRVYRGALKGGWDLETFPELALTVVARPTLDKGARLPALAGMPPLPEEAASHAVLALVHASLDMWDNPDEDFVLDEAQLAAARVDYVAAGHWHRTYEFRGGETIGYYPGSPEPVSRDPRDRGVALLVDLQPGQPPAVAAVTVGRIACRTLDWDVTGQPDLAQLEQQLQAQQDPDVIMRVRLFGERDAALADAVDDLIARQRERWFHFSVDDQSDWPLPAGAVPGETLAASLIAQRYHALIQEYLARHAGDPAAQAVGREALQIGLALLEGRELWS